MRLEYIKAGEIVTTHGLKGEMKVLPWIDSPEDLCDFDRVRIQGKEYKVENGFVTPEDVKILATEIKNKNLNLIHT